MASRRSTGSSMSVASDTGMPEMALPVTSSPSRVRTLTGTDAARGTSGSSLRARSQLRSEPAQMASMTSFTFTLKAFFTDFMSSSDTEQYAHDLCSVTALLKRVRATPAPGSGRAPDRAERTSSGALGTRRPISLTKRIGVAANEGSDERNIRGADGIASGTHGSVGAVMWVGPDGP